MTVSEKYDVILADPPWWYSNRSADRKSKFGGGARAHYEVMRDSELLAMAPFIDSLCEENCALFLWVTCPRMDFGIELLKAWGFRYATVVFHWVKTRKNGLPIFGPGSYTGSNLEVCLLGVRGSMPPKKKLQPSLIMYPRRKHSEKPPVIRTRIERMYPDAKRIELFARHRVDGWDAWGDQVGILDEGGETHALVGLADCGADDGK